MMELDKIYNEDWKDIVINGQRIGVSRQGQVRTYDRVVHKSNGRRQTVKGRVLCQVTIYSGYKMVYIGGSGFLVHRLVAKAFIPKPDNLTEVNHIDENKANNDLSNLEWVTHKYNSNYGSRNALISKTLKESGLRNKGVIGIGKRDNVKYNSIHSAAQALGGSAANICKCLKGKIKTAYGYEWKYAN